MNKKVILSIALLSGITQYSYAKIPVKHLVIAASSAAFTARYAWHIKVSKKETPLDVATDALLAIGEDTGYIFNNTGEWLEKQSQGARENLPNKVAPITEMATDEPKTAAADDPVEESGE